MTSPSTEDDSDRRDPDWKAELEDKAVERVLTAGLSLVFIVLVLLLPPIVSGQLRSIEKTLQKPVIDVIVALVLAAVAAWKRRFLIGVVAVSVLVSSVQIGEYLVTTSASRHADSLSASWTAVPLSASYAGVVPANKPDVFGYADIEWTGTTVTLKLRSKTGTTQQGIYQVPPPATHGFYFAATVADSVGGNAVVCPLIFGISNIRNYFTFRIQSAPGGIAEAVAYQIIQNSSEFTSGFHALLIGQDSDIPYYNHWDLIDQKYDGATRLAILMQGSFGQFFVDGRRVFQRVIDDLPNDTVSIGTTVLANNLLLADGEVRHGGDTLSRDD